MLRGSKLCASPPDSHENADNMKHIEDMEHSSLAGLTRENNNSVEGEKSQWSFFKKKVNCVGTEIHLCGHGL